VVIQLILLNTLLSLEVLIPTTLYLAVLFTLGRLYRESEMAALAAAGVGESRILAIALKLGVLAGAVVLLLSMYGRPWAYAKTYALEQAQTDGLDLTSIPAGTFVKLGDDGYVLFAREVDISAERLRHVFVQVDQPRGSQIIHASSARMLPRDAHGSRAVEFFNGHAYLLDRNGPRDINMRFDTFLYHFPEEERIGRFRRKAIDTGALGRSNQPKDIAEYQWRLTTPVATILLALLAVPLGRANPRQSRVISFVVAMLAYVLMFSLSGFVRTGIEDGAIPARPGLLLAYLPIAILLCVLLALPYWRLRWRR
jgi:lipopolysaccharide export system permease protein